MHLPIPIPIKQEKRSTPHQTHATTAERRKGVRKIKGNMHCKYKCFNSIISLPINYFSTHTDLHNVIL